MGQPTRADRQLRRCAAIVMAAAIALSACSGAPDAEPPVAADLADEGANADDGSTTVDGDPAEPSEIDNQLTIVLCDDRLCSYPTDEQLDDLRARLAADDDVLSADFESREEAYDRFVEAFADMPDIVDTVEASTMPASFRLTLPAGVDPDVIAARYEVLPGVDAVDRVTEGNGDRVVTD